MPMDPTPPSAYEAYFMAAEMGRATPELDLHGMTREDALRVVDEELDRAYMEGVEALRIVHGAGTGALREAIRALLDKHPHVKAWRPAQGTQASGVVHVLFNK